MARRRARSVARDASGRAGRGGASTRRVPQSPTDAAKRATTHPERAPPDLVRGERGGAAHHRHVRRAEHKAQGDAESRALAAPRAVRARRKRPSARGGSTARGRALAPAPVQRLAVGERERRERADRADRGGDGDGGPARDSCARDDGVSGGVHGGFDARNGWETARAPTQAAPHAMATAAMRSGAARDARGA